MNFTFSSRRAVVALILTVVVVAAAAPLFAQSARRAATEPAVWEQPQQPQQQNDFVPLKDLKDTQVAQEQLPAAPLVMAAYAFVWVALLVYVWSVWRRVGAVQRELTDLRRRAERKA